MKLLPAEVYITIFKQVFIMKCSICGKEIEDFYSNDSDLIKHKMCFTCNFWREQYEADKNERKKYEYAIIDNSHYVLCPPTDSMFKGFGGHKFTIRFFDGTVKICDNLWHQGIIPEHLRDKFPNNAEFDYEWKDLGNVQYLTKK